jgi:hypothetical protein
MTTASSHTIAKQTHASLTRKSTAKAKPIAAAHTSKVSKTKSRYAPVQVATYGQTKLSAAVLAKIAQSFSQN